MVALATHSLGQQDAETCAIEGRVGGRVYERLRNGAERSWGTVLVWEPPRRIVLTWHPGRDERMQQEVEVRFSLDGAGTVVQLEHRGWEALGEDALEVRAQYEGGWEIVLTHLVTTAR